MHKSRELTSAGTWWSIATHALVFILLICAGHKAWKVRTVEMRGGERTILYWQAAANRVRIPPRKVTAARQRPDRTTPSRPQTIPVSESQPKQEISANDLGGSATGSEDIIPAFPVFSPSPHITDRSLLPATNVNVVVDVNVSAQGDVLKENLVQGLGNSLDQVILDTVKNWKFHPASSNGNAVDSVAELIFPLSPKWTG